MEEITAIFKDLILRSIVTDKGYDKAKQLNRTVIFATSNDKPTSRY